MSMLNTGYAQHSEDSLFDAVAKKGISEVYDLEFENANQEFDRLVLMDPGNPAGHFFHAMVIWWEIMIDIDNEQYDREFYDSLDVVIDMCDAILKKDEDNVNAIFFKGGAIGFKGRLKFHRDDYLAAANAGRKALPLVAAAQELAPTNVDILLGAGMYNYYADVIPEEYPFLKPMLLFIPSGDKKKGIEQLRTASEKGKYASAEAAYLLMQIYLYYEKDYAQAHRIVQDLHTRFPKNMLFYKILGRCDVLLGDWAGATRIFEDIIARVRKGERGFDVAAEREAEYYLGQYALNIRQGEGALKHFFRCDELSRPIDKNGPSGFMIMANLRMGNIYDLQGKRDLAIAQYQKVAGWKDYKGSVGLAEQYLRIPYTQ
jgi:tetratricopeptide (TPR) repeat protein